MKIGGVDLLSQVASSGRLYGLVLTGFIFVNSPIEKKNSKRY